MFDLETVRFDECIEVFRGVLQKKESSEELASHCGIIYSDIPLQSRIRIPNNIRIEYCNRMMSDGVQVDVLAVIMRKGLDIFLLPVLSEALACVLTFCFKTRFAASRWLGHLDREGKLGMLMDPFVRIASASAGPLHVRPLSTDTINIRAVSFEELMKTLARSDPKDFRKIMRTFRLYQLALLTYPIDLGLSYSLLVSSVDNLGGGTKEKFANFIKEYLPQSFWTEFDSRAWEEDRWLDTITPWKHSIIDSYRERFEREGEKALQSMRKVLDMRTIERIKSAFEDKTELPMEEKRAYDHVLNHWYLYRVDMKLTLKELRPVLLQVYHEVRCAFYHGGRSPSETAVDRYETARLKPIIKADKSIEWQRDIPSFYAFERIVHDSVLGYLGRVMK